MWFRLKEDYALQPDEIHRDSWGMTEIGRGAPIHVTLGLGHDFPRTSQCRFVFSCGGLHHLKLEQLELPNFCQKNRMGDVYCARSGRFFVSIAHYDSASTAAQMGALLANQLFNCPLCGQLLEPQPEYPYQEQEGYVRQAKHQQEVG